MTKIIKPKHYITPGLLSWLTDSGSSRIRSSKLAALQLALEGPRAWGENTFSEVARIERVHEGSLRAFVLELRLHFGIFNPLVSMADAVEGINAVEKERVGRGHFCGNTHE